MAKLKGTNGDDTITGTTGDDSIVPLLGMDTVDGGAGYDTLTVDYSSLASSYWLSTMALGDDGSWTGGVTGGPGDKQNYVGFSNVERVVFAATQDIDYLTVDLGTLTPDKTRLSLDGAGGDDTLSVLGSTLSKRITLTTAGDGSVVSNFATLAGWDTYDIRLGVATGNKLVLGAGDDIVGSTGGSDTVDGGAGVDTWTGYYQGRDDDLTTLLNGTGATVSSSTVQLASLTNVETFSLQSGAGDDVVTAYGGAGYLSGGDGSDEVLLNPLATGAATVYQLSVDSSGRIAGHAVAASGGDWLNFRDYEGMILTGGTAADQFLVDASTSVLANYGVGLDLRGGQGTDSLTLDLRAQGAAQVLNGGADAGHVDGLGGLNVITWTGIEALTVKFGAGDDRVAFNAATQSIVVDGGAGFDTIDFHDATGSMSINLGTTVPQITAGHTISIANVEGVIGSSYADYLVDGVAGDRIQGGDGADTIQSIAASTAGTDTFEGGAGFDTIRYLSASAAVYVSLGLATAQNTGGSGVDILSGFESLFGSNYDDILTGSTLDDVLNGALGDDVLEGGAGADILDGNDGNDTVRYTGATGAITVSLATLASQNTGGAGSDSLSSIENVIGSTYNDTLGGNANANRIVGGRGADTLTGLGGADVFVYSSKLDSTGSAFDRITDFSHSQGDKISLLAVDAIDSSPRFNDAFSYIGSNAFHGVAGELRVIAARGGGFFVYGDTNGDKTADLTIFVDGTTPPFSTDFVL